MDWIIILVISLALIFDFTNGWNDSANAIATVVSTRVLKPYTAVIFAASLNILGAFFSQAVAKMIGGGIVDPRSVTMLTVCCALFGGIDGIQSWDKRCPEGDGCDYTYSCIGWLSKER